MPSEGIVRPPQCFRITIEASRSNVFKEMDMANAKDLGEWIMGAALAGAMVWMAFMAGSAMVEAHDGYLAVERSAAGTAGRAPAPKVQGSGKAVAPHAAQGAPELAKI